MHLSQASGTCHAVCLAKIYSANQVNTVFVNLSYNIPLARRQKGISIYLKQ